MKSGAATRRPTMKDVAAVAGVSLATVSRVVNEVPVDPELASRVHDAVARLGYRRDAAAAGLRRANRSSRSLGLILDDVSNPFFSAVHRGIEDVARERGVLIFSGSSDDDAAVERQLATSFSAHGVDGLVVVPAGSDHRYLERERTAGVALVFVDRPPQRILADAVLSDNVGGIRAAVAHLEAAGHRRIGYLGDRSRLFTATERLAGFGGDPALVRMDLIGSEAAEGAARELLTGSAPPTALVCGQNQVTIGALYALRALGLQRRVALVGFDDIPLGGLVSPGVTVVAQDPAALGRHAAELLFARLAGDDSPPRRIVVPTRLIARGSGELLPD
jgi:LacI family transcriptional regulator